MTATETQPTTSPATTDVELSDLGRKALELLAENRPLPKEITKRTTNALINRGLVTLDGAHGMWITAEGKAAIGWTKPEGATLGGGRSRAAKCADCGVRLTSRTKTVSNSDLCSYCFEEAGNENEHQDGAPSGVHAEGGSPCRECGTYDPAAFWAATKTKPKNLGGCGCGCGEATAGGWYRPGHDAKHVSILLAAFNAGTTTRDSAKLALKHSPSLQLKLENAIDNAVGKE